MRRITIQLTSHIEHISDAIESLQTALINEKVKKSDMARAILMAEEILGTMIAHAKSPEELITIRIESSFGNVRIRLEGRGSSFDRSDVETPLYFVDNEEANEVIEGMVSRIFGNSLIIRNRNGINLASFQVSVSKYKQLSLMLGALSIGLLAGFLIRNTVPETVRFTMSDKVFSPVYTMFLSAIKMIVGPLVFLSIASSIADFRDLRKLSRIAGKVIGSYCATSLLAILLGAGVWFLFPIGNPSLQKLVTDTAAASAVPNAQDVSVSLMDAITGIVPSDVIRPFLQVNMLQIIFIAALFGLAAGDISYKLHLFREILTELYMIASKMTALIIGVMPIAVFCAMAKMTMTMEIKSLMSVLTWIPVVYLGDLLMLVVYGFMILVIGRLNPFVFYRKFFPVMLTGFTFASSNAALPLSIETCTQKLGISNKICSFSLPLGATINMDGSCITMMITALFMAKTFNIPITGQLLMTLTFSIFMLSIGAPGVPGGALVCISILLPQIGIPAEAISIIIGLYSIIGMMLVCVNITGDAVVTLLVAKSEKMLDCSAVK